MHQLLVAKVSSAGKKLKIIDVFNNRQKEYGHVGNIGIKVETSNGVEGWLEWMNGGD